jgi:hypothetical protein
MAYVGNQPVPQATQTRDRFVATSGQTSFATSGYTPGFVDVYLDGVKLDQDEYTATNGSDVVLDSGATTGQILEVVAFSSFDVADIRNMTQPLGLKAYTTTQRNALTNTGVGDTIYNSTVGSIEFYDGSNWIATNLIPTVNSVTGTIYAGVATDLTLSITNATEGVTVRFSEGGATIVDITDVTVTSGSASVTVPAAVYGQTAGDTISVSILNQDGTPSSNAVNKTVKGLPTGGTITTSGSYVYHTFTSSGNLSVPSGFSSSVEYLVVAGGGSGGADSGGAQGGGGAGGYISSSTSISQNTYSITVGAGGAGTSGNDANNPGSNSSAFGSTAIGGGGGGSRGTDNAGDGGSGGGSSSSYSSYTEVGSGTSGQGNRGGYGLNQSPDYPSGGGGGAGAVGNNYASSSTSGAGGAGLQWLDGDYYAGGGGGAAYGSGNYGAGGIGGGGRGGTGEGGNGVSGSSNTGGGGGGGGNSNGTSGSGGSGVVIVRYQLS